MKHARPDYARIQDPDKRIPENEPVFLLRAQDTLFSSTLHEYADKLERLGGGEEMVEAIREHAQLGMDWPHRKNIPDMPPLTTVNVVQRADYAAHGSFHTTNGKPRAIAELAEAIQKALTNDEDTVTHVTIFDNRNTRRDQGRESKGSWIAKFRHEPEQERNANIQVIALNRSNAVLPHGNWMSEDDARWADLEQVRKAVTGLLREAKDTHLHGFELSITQDSKSSGKWEVYRLTRDVSTYKEPVLCKETSKPTVHAIKDDHETG